MRGIRYQICSYVYMVTGLCVHVLYIDNGPMFLYICVHMYIFVTMVPCFFSDPLQHKGSTRSGGCPQLTGLSPGVFLLSS